MIRAECSTSLAERPFSGGCAGGLIDRNAGAFLFGSFGSSADRQVARVAQAKQTFSRDGRCEISLR